MQLSPGERLSHYEIIGEIGRGGMGVVYRARDARLGRDVALKVSTEQFSQRFDREARVIASLNHPNICTLFDVGTNFLVMELIDGDAPRGPLPEQTILGYAAQIADALDYAHERGITHRDLKPGNLKITPDGKLKVLDFGLAKTVQVSNSADSLTLTMGGTEAGVILGTAAYMAPEQAKGKPVDRRADIWAFGVILYELSTGKRPFHGENISDTLASVLRDEPDLGPVPLRLRALITKCLEKDPKKRLRDAGDAMSLVAGQSDSIPPRARRPYFWMGATALLSIVAAASLLPGEMKTPETSNQIEFHIDPPQGMRVGPQPPVISPDGTKIAFIFTDGTGRESLWVRDLGSVELRELKGADAVAAPRGSLFWSPNSRSIAFFAFSQQLKRIPVQGGPAQTLAPAGGGFVGGSWGADGSILIASSRDGILRIPENGGAPNPVTSLAQSSAVAFLANPQLLSKGRFLFIEAGPSARAGIYIADLDAPEKARRIVAVRSETRFHYQEPTPTRRSGILLYTSAENQLLAQEIRDEDFSNISGPIPITDAVSSFSLSENGTLAYATAGFAAPPEIHWIDMTGKHTPALGPARYNDIALSRDGRLLVYSANDSVGQNLWVVNLAVSGAPTRLTFDTDANRFPVWSPDNRWVAFAAGVGRAHDKIVRIEIETSRRETLVEGGADVLPLSWSNDGKYLLYRDIGKETSSDLWLLPVDSRTSEATPLVQTQASETFSALSPDGSWVAYTSDELGRVEVFVQSVPPGRKYQISTDGGRSPKWSADGRRLFYVSTAGDFMSVAVEGKVAQPFGRPQAMFRSQWSGNSASYGMAPDGRVLAITPSSPARQIPPFTVRINAAGMLKTN